MNDIEVLIALVAVAAVLVRFADLVAIPYPIVLVLGGLGIGSLPAFPELTLDPDVIFLVFIPPILQSAGYWASPQALRAEGKPLTWLALGLSLATMVVVAVVARNVIPELTYTEALVLGAIVAPTDPVAAIATFSRIGASERVELIVEGESMVNDATALVAYKVALAAVVTGTFSVVGSGIDLVVSVAGGLAIGLTFAWAARQAIRRLDDVPLAILLSVLLGYVSFGVADQVGASGVLAVVSAGLYAGWYSDDIFDADTRLNAQAFWRVLVFALNAILFILVGLQFPGIVQGVSDKGFSAAEVIGYGALIGAVVISLRIAWQFIPPLLARIVPAAAALDTGETWRERLLVGWSGMRGAVSLAAALAIPLQLDSGAPFADRDLIIYLTVAVILITLVLQGLTLPALISALGLGMARPWAPDEAIARLAAAQAALDRLDELEASGDTVSEAAIERLRELYRARFARCVASLSGDGAPAPIDNPLEGYRRLRKDLITNERGILLEMRDQGRLRTDVLRRIQRDLDLDEARLRS